MKKITVLLFLMILLFCSISYPKNKQIEYNFYKFNIQTKHLVKDGVPDELTKEPLYYYKLTKVGHYKLFLIRNYLSIVRRH